MKELVRKTEPSDSYGPRLNVEIETPIGVVTIELRSDVCVSVTTIGVDGRRMFLKLPDKYVYYRAEWRMRKVDGKWVNWEHESISPTGCTVYTDVPPEGQERISSYHRIEIHGMKMYGREPVDFNETFDPIDAIVRPCILQWLEEHPDELREQGINAYAHDLKKAEAEVEYYKKLYEDKLDLKYKALAKLNRLLVQPLPQNSNV